MSRPPSVHPALSIVIPAHNEASYLGRCLSALAAQTGQPAGPCPASVRIIVVANACTDGTIAVATAHRREIESRGWSLTVLDLEEAGKTQALNAGDRAAEAMGSNDLRLYLDADIVVEPTLLAELMAAGRMAPDSPRYITGRMTIAAPRSWFTRRYVALWRRVPFLTTADGATGAGLFAVNAAGRARWGAFPAIVADDTFVRLHFEDGERIALTARYNWPAAEGFHRLVRVRRRQDAGTADLHRCYPELARNRDTGPVGLATHLGLFLGGPVDYIVYCLILVCARLGRHPAGDWNSGR